MYERCNANPPLYKHNGIKTLPRKNSNAFAKLIQDKTAQLLNPLLKDKQVTTHTQGELPPSPNDDHEDFSDTNNINEDINATNTMNDIDNNQETCNLNTALTSFKQSDSQVPKY